MPESRIKLILWDVDGTIYNSDEIFYRVFCHELNKEGIKIDPLFFAQHGFDECIYHLNLDPEKIQRIKENISHQYQIHKILKKLKFKKNAKKTILSLSKKYKFATASGERKQHIEDYLQATGIRNLFGFIGHGQLVPGRKNNPDYFKTILNHFHLKKDECIFIGDSLFDAKAASFGIKTVIIPTMFSKYQKFPENCLIIKDVGELTKIIQ
jgi:HAD superfamily hydrolase (TIGR01549 family)